MMDERAASLAIKHLEPRRPCQKHGSDLTRTVAELSLGHTMTYKLPIDSNTDLMTFRPAMHQKAA